MAKLTQLLSITADTVQARCSQPNPLLHLECGLGAGRELLTFPDKNNTTLHAA